ncbi:MAG: PaaI family thioesterase [Burkholderiales bacterium]
MPDAAPQRRLEITWEDPQQVAAAARTLSGLEFLQAMIAGRIPPPPVANLLNMRLAEVHKGRAVFEIDLGEQHYNPIGVVHGGIAATLLDSAMGCAVQTTLEAGVAYTTLEIKVNMVRAVTLAAGTLSAVASVIHVGSRTATAEGRFVDAAGKLYAHATTTCIILRP